MADAVLVHGAERLAVRTAEQLRLLEVEVVELGDMDVAELEARLAQGGAQALVLCDEGDIVNFHLALAARELQPELRLVVRLFNLELGQQAERLLSCRALSASQLAAPAFVEAALRDDYAQRIHVGDHELRVLPGGAGSALLALDSAGGLLPGKLGQATSVIGQPRASAAVTPRRPRRGQVASVARVLRADRRLRLLGAMLLALVAATTAIYARAEDLSLVDALHRSVVAVLGSDVLEPDAPDWLRLYDIGVLVLGVAALALVIALLTDAIVSTRLALALGGLPRRLRGHAIVCGLGTVGYRIGSELLAAGIDVCGVDIGDEERLARARSAGIAAAIGNGAQAGDAAQPGRPGGCVSLLRHRRRRGQPRGRAGRARRESRAAHRAAPLRHRPGGASRAGRATGPVTQRRRSGRTRIRGGRAGPRRDRRDPHARRLAARRAHGRARHDGGLDRARRRAPRAQPRARRRGAMGSR